MDSIPEGLFDIMSMVDLGGDGTIQLSIEEPRLEEACEILSDAFDGVVNFNTTGSSVVVDVISEPAEQENQLIEEDNVEEEIIPEGESDEIGEPAVNQFRGSFLANTMVDPSQITETRVTTDANVYSTIAQIVGGESVNTAKQLDDSLRELNIYFNKAIALNRKIEQATKRFSETSPEVINLVEQAGSIAGSYELVSDVYFTNSEIVFVTTPLVTDDRWDGHKRLIGIMRIGIRLDALFSPNPTHDKSAISIKNLTHRYSSSGGTVWECGHVKASGNTCFGTAFNAVFDAICARDLTYIVESLIRFIKTPNPDDSWGYHMKHWPEAPASEAGGAAENQQ